MPDASKIRTDSRSLFHEDRLTITSRKKNEMSGSPSPTFLRIACASSCVLLSQLLYPVLMTAMAALTFFIKLKRDDNIVFVPCDDDGDEIAGVPDGRPANFGSKVKSSLLTNHNMFGWADKGQWESADTSDSETKSERDWFRIGFEPVFADFTRKGSWFMVYSLVEVGGVSRTVRWCGAGGRSGITFSLSCASMVRT